MRMSVKNHFGKLIKKAEERQRQDIKKIEDELKDCIKSQNFEKAIELRDQLRKMRP